MRSLVFWALLFTLMCIPRAHASDLCITVGSVDFVLKGFTLKPGKSFVVSGYSNRVNVTNIVHRPVSGEAIVSSDRSTLLLGLTEYGATIAHEIGSSTVGGTGLIGDAAHYVMSFSAPSSGKLGPGVTGSAIVPSEGSVAQIFACGRHDGDLTLP